VIYAGPSAQEIALPLIVITALLTAVLATTAIIDLRTFRIPDVISLPLMLCGFVMAWFLPLLPLGDHLIGAAAGFGLFAIIGEVYFRNKGHEGLGLGDAKLFGAAGAWLGWQALPTVLLIASVGGLGYALLRRSARRVAFGPWLALGFWLAWLAQRNAGFW
jgi:leader peptidase (prepilin peptidase) / N-methyltransferase